MIYRELKQNEYEDAINFALKVFNRFEAPFYNYDSSETFYNLIHNDEYISTLRIYGAFDNDIMAGIIATKNNGNHIALFYVDENYQRKGIGKKLFKMVRLDNLTGELTVNSSMYAIQIYHKLGFCHVSSEKITDGIKYIPMKYTDTVLKTNRLVLRPWKNHDANDLYEYAKDPDIGPIAGWPPHTSVENSLEIIKEILSEPETYAVSLKENGKSIGSVGIMFMGSGSAPIKENEAEIGYWIGKPFWGRGLIPEAVKMLLCRCFEEFKCDGVWCGYYDGNSKSKRVQEKCGFIYHHTKKDATSPMGDIRTEHYTYITKSQWEKLK